MTTGYTMWPCVNPMAVRWYRKLHVNQKIMIKAEYFELACGFPYEKLRTMFSLLELVTIFFDKLVAEGIINPLQAEESDR